MVSGGAYYCQMHVYFGIEDDDKYCFCLNTAYVKLQIGYSRVVKGGAFGAHEFFIFLKGELNKRNLSLGASEIVCGPLLL